MSTSPPRACAAPLARNNPSPAPPLSPYLLNGANKSLLSSMPIPSSITSMINLFFIFIVFSDVYLFFMSLELIVMVLFFGENLMAFCTKFCTMWVSKLVCIFRFKISGFRSSFIFFSSFFASIS